MVCVSVEQNGDVIVAQWADVAFRARAKQAGQGRYRRARDNRSKLLQQCEGVH